MEGRPRILIIDDEDVVLDSCRQILEGEAYAISTSPDGALGLRQAQAFQPDLVFVDLKMPGISGFEVLERIRTLDPSIVTVVITGYATLGSAVEAMQKGTYDFLPKPFTPDEFRLITRRGLEKRRLVLETIALRREKDMLREHFAAVVSHELKAPLAAVQQNLAVLIEDLSEQLTERQKSRLERMKSRLNDLLRLIHTWLRAISGDIEKIREDFGPTSVTSAITKAIEIIHPLAARKDIQIATALQEPLSPVLGDEGTLVEALVNVATNAVKYSHAGSAISVSAEETGGCVRISIADSGVGIAPDDLPFIFGDFYRGRSGAPDQAGSGLGLAITRRIVEAHFGTITVDSRPGEGSTFEITLPVHQAGLEGHHTPGAGEPENLQGGRVR